ncbi:hypothetical protein, partial [Phaeovulum sp.]|uniref:hypothetical protein n=1 Tax=Phaeovulum sp. TaxID=2934796 RepID=UPI003565D6E3
MLLDLAPQRLVAGAGYSSNLHWQLFTGSSADCMGFFCDWGLKSGQFSDEAASTAHRLLARTDRNLLFNALLRVAARKLGRRDDNIPWSERRHFDSRGTYLFNSSGLDAIAHRARLGVVEMGDYIATFAAADAAIAAGQRNVFAVVNELDELGHKAGGTAPEYAEFARKVLERARLTVAHYRRAYPAERVRLLSDHGMHDVHYSVDPARALHRHIGIPGQDYLLYTDSVYLRAWFGNDAVASRFVDATAGLTSLRYLDDAERATLGISSPSFGDIIGVLADGVVFSPNMFALWVRGGPNGMHGYLSN